LFSTLAYCNHVLILLLQFFFSFLNILFTINDFIFNSWYITVTLGPNSQNILRQFYDRNLRSLFRCLMTFQVIQFQHHPTRKTSLYRFIRPLIQLYSFIEIGFCLFIVQAFSSVECWQQRPRWNVSFCIEFLHAFISAKAIPCWGRSDRAVAKY